MTEKQTRVLSLLATGIAIELILMVAYIVGRGHSEQLLSTRNQGFAVGDNSYQSGSAEMESGDLTMLHPEGAPITDEDHIEGYDPSYFEETPPFWDSTEDPFLNEGDPFASEMLGADGLSYGGDAYEGNPFSDSGYNQGYPAPIYGDPGSYGDPGYMLPTLPPGPGEVLPTDVPSMIETPTLPAATLPAATLPVATLPAPTATNAPFVPLPTDPNPYDPYQPTAQVPSPTATAALSMLRTPTPTAPALTQAVPTQPAPSQPVPTQTAPASTSAAPTNTPVPPTAVTATAVPPTAAPATATPAPSNLGGLLAVRRDAAPKLDGAADDAAWKDAPGLTVSTSGGANKSATSVTVEAVYDNENVYFLLRWSDPTQSFLYYPWEKQSDGSWKQLTGPNPETDENDYFEDQIALFFNDGAGDLLDLWQWQSVRGDGQADDRYLEDAQYPNGTSILSYAADPSDEGGPAANRSKDRKLPVYMAKDGGDRSGAPGFIREGETVPFDDELFKTGERVPFVITSPREGDRGDIQAAARYQNGAWTLELRRALETGSRYDVQFSDLTKVYTFGLATFDNTQARPAAAKEALPLRFVE